jgi:hypothetical protein
MRRSIAVAVLALVILTGALVPRLVGGNKAPTTTQPAVEHDFGERVLMIYCRKGPQASDVGSAFFEKVQSRRLGDRYFFTGRTPAPDKPGQPFRGVITWAPLSDVVQIHEFDNLEAAVKVYEAVKKHEATKKAEGKDPLPPRPGDGN